MIIKNQTHSNFAAIPNFIFKSELNPFDKGVLCTLYSLPKDWDISIRGLASIMHAGRDAIASSLKRIEQAGYIRRYQMRSVDGKLSTNDCELIIPTNSKNLENADFQPYPENPDTVNPNAENQPQYKNKKINNKDDDDTRVRAEKTSPAEPVMEELDNPLIDSIIEALEDPNRVTEPKSQAEIIASRIRRQQATGSKIVDVRRYAQACLINYQTSVQRSNHQQKPPASKKKNRFNNFNARKYDVDELERRLLESGN